jgi:hypothetical protein
LEGRPWLDSDRPGWGAGGSVRENGQGSVPAQTLTECVMPMARRPGGLAGGTEEGLSTEQQWSTEKTPVLIARPDTAGDVCLSGLSRASQHHSFIKPNPSGGERRGRSLAPCAGCWTVWGVVCIVLYRVGLTKRVLQPTSAGRLNPTRPPWPAPLLGMALGHARPPPAGRVRLLSFRLEA